MKKLPPFILLAAVGILCAPSPSLRAQGTLHVDASGNPTTTLSLSGTNIAGPLSPALLPTDPTFNTLTVNQQATFLGSVVVPSPVPTDSTQKAASTAFVQQVVSGARTGDGSGLTNLNASALSTGTAAPARLGTGTPTSTTFLRGDGSWAGQTPGGNTIAATGSLLMGDGAGNAVAVPGGADLLRILKARLDIKQANDTFPANALATALSFSGTINADGTITIPANGRVYWLLNNPGSVASAYYGYVVAATEAAAGAASLHLNLGYDVPGTADSTLAPGVYRSVFTSPASGTMYVDLNNATNAPLTVYLPFLASLDAGLSFFQSGADHTPVAAPPVADLDFTRFSGDDRAGRSLAEKQTTLAADSVTGADANAGTLYAPRLTLSTQTLSTGSVFGLYRGSTFRDSLPFATLGSTQGVVVQDLAFGSEKNLPVVSGLDLAPSASFTGNGDGTYSYLWTPAGAVVNDGYGNVFAVEINTATEAATPVASRHRLLDVTSQGAATATAGTVWIQAPGTGAGQSGSATQWKAILHPTDGLAPGSGSYRYEVVSRVGPAIYPSQDVNNAGLGGLELVCGSNGYGALSGPTATVADRLVLLHGTTHNAVLGGGSLQRSVFYEMGDPLSIMLAWYAASPAGTLRWNTSRCLFFANAGNRVPNGLISHSSDGTNFDRGDLSDCAFLGARLPDGSLQGTGIDYVNVNGGVINRVYVQGFALPFGNNMPPALETKHSVFRQVNTPLVAGSFHDNVVAAESASNPANAASSNASCGWQFHAANAVVTHNLFWAHGLATALANDAPATGITFYPGVTTGTATRNIIAVDPATPATPSFYVQVPQNAAVSFDFNLVICTGPFGASRFNEGNYSSWAQYLAANPTLDQHSLFIDLSTDPRGLGAVFVNPANGDFRWAQTDVARRCAAYCQANHVGPAAVTSRWLLVPTVDEAVRLLTDL